MDFIHPKDRLAFTNQITSKLLASLDKDDSSSGYSFNSGTPLAFITLKLVFYVLFFVKNLNAKTLFSMLSFTKSIEIDQMKDCFHVVA